MDAEVSEGLFASYLDAHGMDYERHFRVSGEKNVDFKIAASDVVLCDVKEVHDSRMGSPGIIDAYTHIREDINDLRKKFKKKKPTNPVVLVTMNFSSNFFTALTVARAILGDIGAEFDSQSRGEAHHLPRGNASFTKTTNTSISGVLVYDCATGNHTYFSNPFAKFKIPSNYFPSIKEIEIKRNAGEQELVRLSGFMFWECNDKEKP